MVELTINKGIIMEISHFLAVFAIILTNLGTVLTLYFQLDKKLDKQREDTNAILKGIAEEIKDFHGRLCTIEQKRGK